MASSGPHSYWRLYFAATIGPQYPAMSEVVFATAVGGAQAATGGTAISSSDYPGFPAANCFDGSNATHWFANNTATGWVGYQFAAPVTIAEARATYNYSNYPYAPTSMTLDYSDNGSTWTTVGTVANISIWTVPETRAIRNATLFTGSGHGWWRAYWITNQAGASCAAAEVVFAASAGSAQQASNGVAVGSGYDSPSVAGLAYDKAFDGSGATAWSSLNGTSTNQWVGYAFSANTVVGEVRITNYSAAANYAPKDLRIDYSDDGTVWTTAATFMGLAAWTAGETRSFSLLPTSARATQVALEHWLAANADARMTQVFLEHWGPAGSSAPIAVLTQIAIEEWFSVAAPTAAQARAWIMA